MENASKALLIAAGVLLAILVISVGVMFYNNLHSATDSYVSKLDATELKKYNSPFEVFISRTDVSAQEIVTVIAESQQKDKNIQVSITNMGDTKYLNMQNFTTDELNDFLNENIQYHEEGTEGSSGKLVYFKCVDADGDGITYGADGRVTAIEFVKVGATISEPIIGNPVYPEVPIPDPQEKNEDENKTGNSAPYFANTTAFSTNVIDPDGDWTFVYATVDIFTLGTDKNISLKKQQSNTGGGGSPSYGWGSPLPGGGLGSRPKPNGSTTIKVDPSSYITWPSRSVFYWEHYKDYAKTPQSIPGEYWGQVNIKANGSKEYADDYQSKLYKISGVYVDKKSIYTDYWYYICRVKFYAKDAYHEWVESDYFYQVNRCSGGTKSGGHYEDVVKYRECDRLYL